MKFSEITKINYASPWQSLRRINILISLCYRQLWTGYAFATTGAVAVALGLNNITKVIKVCSACLMESINRTVLDFGLCSMKQQLVPGLDATSPSCYLAPGILSGCPWLTICCGTHSYVPIASLDGKRQCESKKVSYKDCALAVSKSKLEIPGGEGGFKPKHEWGCMNIFLNHAKKN